MRRYLIVCALLTMTQPTSTPALHLTVAPNLGDIGQSLQTLTAWMHDRALPDEVQHHAQLALEELAVNVATHGQQGPVCASLVCVWARLGPRHLRLVVADNGPPFNPLSAPAPDPWADLDDRAVGGLGLYLLRTLGQMRYQRLADWNRVHVRLTWPASAPSSDHSSPS